MKMRATIMLLGMMSVATASALEGFENDIIKTSAGDLTITFLGHGSIIFQLDGKIVHVDPYSRLADYTKLLKADLILITHEHQDHLDAAALQDISATKTVVVLPPKCAARVTGGMVMTNGSVQTILGIKVEAIPAYNIISKRPDGSPFHPKGDGNGYVLTFGDKRIYVAGDTENTPEMKSLRDIDCAFLPMNMPYTMTPAMVADAAKAFTPKILYPYHYGETNPSKLLELLKEAPSVEVRIRKMQ